MQIWGSLVVPDSAKLGGTPLNDGSAYIVSRARLSHGERESGQLRIKRSCCTVSSGRTVQSVDNNLKCW